MLGEGRFLEKGHFNLVRWTKEHGGVVVGGTRTPGTWELYYRFREKYLKRCCGSVVECV